VHDRAYDDDDDSNLGLRRTLSYQEFGRLWRASQSPLVVVVELCGRNGLRTSEARGLRWECIDLEAMTLTVNRQMSSRNKLTKTKTRRAQRTTSVDNRTVEVLNAWKKRQDRKRDAAGDL